MKHACVIGWPISHSRSPLIHGYWLKAYGIDGSYSRLPVQPSDVVHFLQTLADRGLVGCNVTLPHKEVAFSVATETTLAARAVSAANTLWLEGGKLCADNTDVAGFMDHLQASAPGLHLHNSAACVLGAGGAARAIIYGLLQAGVAQVRILNRTHDRAEALARHFGTQVRAFPWKERPERSRDVALLVNATALGMHGHDKLEFDVSALTPTCVVADIVYAPLETALLRGARGRGLAVVDGLGMLLHQAVPGFEKWFGVRPEVTPELRRLVAADIEGST